MECVIVLLFKIYAFIINLFLVDDTEIETVH